MPENIYVYAGGVHGWTCICVQANTHALTLTHTCLYIKEKYLEIRGLPIGHSQTNLEFNKSKQNRSLPSQLGGGL